MHTAWQEEDDDWGVDMQSEQQEEDERKAREASSEFARRLEAALGTPPAPECPAAQADASPPKTAPEPEPEVSGAGYEEF